MLKFDLNALTQKLSVFPVKHRIAFAASCCERLLPNYRAFSLMEHWGDIKFLEKALGKVWKLLNGGVLREKELLKLIQKCDAITPDTNDFSSHFTSSALGAARAVSETLECYLDGKTVHAATVAILAHDTIYMFVHVYAGLSYSDPKFEEKILTHPLMIEELEKQRQDIEELGSIAELTPEFLKRLRQSSKKLGLQPFSRGLVDL